MILICDLNLEEVGGTTFAQTLNLFGQLAELDIIRFEQSDDSNPLIEFDLDLPMLTSIHLERVHAIEKLTLNTPELGKVKLSCCSPLNLVFVHGESVERLLTDSFEYIAVKNLKNLQYLWADSSDIDLSFLSGLNQLKEIYLNDLINPEIVESLFEQKRRYGLHDLKIYRCGLLLDGPGDAAIDSLQSFNEVFVHLAENLPKVANEIPLRDSIDYSSIERVDPQVAIELLSRFTDLQQIHVSDRVQDIEGFLNLFKNCNQLSDLWVECDQSQELFDRLPDHSAVQQLQLFIDGLSNLEFLSRMNQLVSLYTFSSIDAELIRKLFKELPFLINFEFTYNDKEFRIQITEDSAWIHPKRFTVCVDLEWTDLEWTDLPDLEAVIKFIFGTETS